jgi:hypothetical protein
MFREPGYPSEVSRRAIRQLGNNPVTSYLRDLSAKYEPIFLPLIRPLAACPANTWPLPSFPRAFQSLLPKGLAWQSPL